MYTYIYTYMYSTEDIVREFKKYGAIGDVYRSTDMGTYIVKNDLCFIRFFSEDDATNALVCTCAQICLHMYLYIYIFMYVHVDYLCVFCMFTSERIYIYRCMCIYMCLYIYVDSYIHKE
jgi:hypothetical protein